MKCSSFYIKSTGLLLLSIGIFTACETTKVETNKVDVLIADIKEQYAPDKRVALFDVEAIKTDDGYLVKGASNLPEAVDAFREQLEEQAIEYTDSIEVLPSAALEGKTYGVIKLSAANLRGKPSHSSELVTQGTMGMPVKVYQKEENWYYVQTPDKYLAWVDNGGITLMDKADFEQWENSEKLIYTQTFGSSYAETDKNTQVVSDLVAGNVMELVAEQDDFYEVKYPDGRTAFVSKAEAEPYKSWKEALSFTKEALVTTSKKMMGVPYLWGGTSTKGVDCSGFTKTIYLMNGMIIPRDASQQVHEGVLVDDSKTFDKLIPGDLLFFGRQATDSTAEKVVHVGMWIGNNEFIHSAGRVHISSVDKNAENFDEYNYNRYLQSKRVLNEKGTGLLYLTEKDVF
ncbi:C40 family peptidase [Galbibacter sp. EGI 63066]|uniref:C40 family peptidase n=1 Tax=Galbibacter sp. EGI 63066 TaxID=2993559 RepID=UPI00224930D1|nr:C40 family peptidase [Galbibacter sp. EGI 63066]MCX2679029.1 C40 family peptidase [Galbibacter sp. EGI 63066]